MHDKRLGTKSYLQRITEALERWAKIDIEPDPWLAESGYWERIAIALEKMFGDGEDDKGAVVGTAIVGKDKVGGGSEPTPQPEPSKVLLFDGEVTTVGAPFAGTTIDLQGDLPKSDIHVTFNGQDYTLPYNNNGQFTYYGESGDEGPIFVNFPLLINLVEGICHVFTENAGTYSLKIWADESSTD